MIRSRLLPIVLGVAIAFISQAISQVTGPTSPAMNAAMQLYNDKKFEEAAIAFSKLTAADPKNGRAWFFLGMSHYSLARYRDAIRAFEANLVVARNPMSMYRLAGCHSRLNEADKAFEWLERALVSGAAQSFNIETDPDLGNIRNDARFKRMLGIADEAKRPCMYSVEARQFDFWIGNWDVFAVGGQKAGTNRVEVFSDGCGLLENWTGTQGGEGKSINFYDSSARKWFQSWIGSDGGALRYSGNFAGDAMRFEGETVGPDGKNTQQKLTFFKIDGNTVRQLAESSADGGKTWTVSYDFKYVRQK